MAAQSQGRSLLPQWAYIVADILVIVLVTFMPWFTVSLEGITGSLGVGAASLGGMLSSSCSLAGLGFQLIATLMKIMPYMGMAASLDSSTSSTITTVLIIYVLVTIVVIALWAGCVICSVRAIIADVKRRPGERAAFSGYALASVAALMSIVCMFLIKAILASMIQYVSMEQIPMYTSAGCWISLILCGALAVLRKRYPAAALTSSSPAGITPNSGQR